MTPVQATALMQLSSSLGFFLAMGTGARRKQGAKRMRGVGLRALLPLYLVIFIGFCGYSLMITLFVPMLMGANGFLGAETTANQRSVVLGILLAIYPLGQFLGSPVLGAFSDRYGRKPVLMISLLVSIAAYVLISWGIEARSLILLAAGCLIGGLAESNIAIA
ncbi:MFS transporter, partial [Hypericibacter sp.]|uniref:MFS transporter n=1 Tax=Hypericibacter sp. TaxID=2705401 RepID=UPI003D6CDD68